MAKPSQIAAAFALILLATPAWAQSQPQAKTETQSPAPKPQVFYIPLQPGQEVEQMELELVDQPDRDLQAKKFKAIQAKAGQSLSINAVALSQNLLATMKGLTRGTDAIQAGDVASNIDTQDPKKLLALILETARERRHAESQEEWDQIVAQFHGKEGRARFNNYLYSTPFVEVTSEELRSQNPGARYFVPVQKVLEVAGNIDVNKAKFTLIKSVALAMLDEEASFHPLSKKLSAMASSLQGACESSQCDFAGEAPVGMLLTSLWHVYRAGSYFSPLKPGEEPPVLDEKDEATLHLRRQICVFKLMHQSCPRLPGLDDIDQLAREERLNCEEPSTLLRGLKPAPASH